MKASIVFIFVFIEFTVIQSTIPAIEYDKKTKDLVSFVKYVSIKYCRACRFLGVVLGSGTFPTEITNSALEDLETENIPVMVFGNLFNNQTLSTNNSTPEINKFRKKGTIFYLFLDTVENEDISTMIIAMRKLDVWNSRAKLLIVLSSPGERSDMQWIQKLFQIIWNNNILNTVIAFWNEDHLAVNVFTYNPFFNNFSINITDKIYNKDIYYNKLIDLNKYNLTTLVTREIYATLKFFEEIDEYGNVTYGGIDSYVMETISKKLNVNLRIVPSSAMLSLRKNASSLEQVADIMDAVIKKFNVEIMFQGRPINKQFRSFLEPIYPHMHDSFCLFMPRGKQIEQFYYLFMVFQPNTWYYIFICFFISVSFYYILHKTAREIVTPKENNQGIDLIFINILRLTLGSCPNIIRRPQSGRCMILFAAIFGLLITNCFTCSLITTLIDVKYNPDITSWSALEAARIKIYFPALGKDIVVNVLNSLNYSSFFLKSVLPDPNPSRLWFLKRLNNSEAFISNYGLAKLFIDSATEDNNDHRRKRFMVFPQDIASNIYTYNVVRGTGSVFYDRFNDLVERIYCSGLPLLWDQRSVLKEQGRMRENQNQDEEKKPINLEHLQTAFVILIICIGLSFTVFICEHICHYYLNGNRKGLANTKKNHQVKEFVY